MHQFPDVRLRDSTLSRHEPTRVCVAEDSPPDRLARITPIPTALNACTALLLILTMAFIASGLAFVGLIVRLQEHNKAEWPDAIRLGATMRLVHSAQSSLPIGPDDKTGPFAPSYAVYSILCSAAKNLQEPSHESLRTFIFFLHGNAGSYRQAVRLSCAAMLEPRVVAKVYSFDFAEQANIHRGRLVWQQAAYVTRAICDVLRSEGSLTRPCPSSSSSSSSSSPSSSDGPALPSISSPSRVWLVGHSMGGVVARLAVQLLATSAMGSEVRVDGIITLNSPNRQPPIFLDAIMVDVYARLWQWWTCGHDECIPVKQQRHTSLQVLQQQEEEEEEKKKENNKTIQKQNHLQESHHSEQTIQTKHLYNADQRPVQLHSLTSGLMDLQVEQRLSELGRPTATMWNWRPTHHLDDTRVCGKTLSHNDILRDHCALMYAMGLIASHHTKSSEGVAVVGSDDSDKDDNEHRFVGARGDWILSLLAVWAEHAIATHMLPCAVAALYIAFVLAAFWPLARRTLLTSLREHRWWVIAMASKVMETRYTLRVMHRATGVVLSTLFIMICGCVILFAAHYFMNVSVWCASPWTHVDKDTRAPVIIVFVSSLLASVGPSLCGAFAAAILSATLRAVLRHVDGCCSYCYSCFNYWWWKKQRQSPPRVLLASFAVYMAGWAVALLGSLQLAERALLWVLLTWILPVAGDGAREARVMITTYALLHALQLMPFLVLPNAYASHTSDGPAMTDPNSAVPEVLLHILFLIYIVRDTWLDEVMRRWRSVRFGGQRQCTAVALWMLALSLMALGAVPMEACRVVWVLIVGFPAFAIGVVLLGAGHVKGDVLSCLSERIRADRERGARQIC